MDCTHSCSLVNAGEFFEMFRGNITRKEHFLLVLGKKAIVFYSVFPVPQFLAFSIKVSTSVLTQFIISALHSIEILSLLILTDV
jgi:hypothetical protein